MTHYNDKDESNLLLMEDFEATLKKAVIWDDPYGLFFLQDKEVFTFVLEAILHESGIVISGEVETEKSILYLKHKVRFDLLARDTKGRIFEIEIQKDPRGASQQRMAFYLGALLGNSLDEGEPYQALPPITSIFITKTDTQKEGTPETIYDLFGSDKQNEGDQNYQLKGIYVNGAMQNDTRLGKLMHDFSTADPDKMLLPIMREKSKFYKERKDGRNKMEGLFADFVKEREKEAKEEGKKIGEEIGEKRGEKRGKKKGEKKGRKKFVLSLLKDGSLPLEKISEMSGFSLEKLEKWKAKIA